MAGCSPTEGGVDSSIACRGASHCDDGIYCNGVERCAPGDLRADIRGCAPAAALPCIDGLVCDEAQARCYSAACENPDHDNDGVGSVECGGADCDDEDPNRFPGNVEVCDGGHDEDCDPSTLGDADLDADGAVDARCCNGERCGTDCDDGRADRAPGNVEACDGLDNDCDDELDEGLARLYYLDADGDGFGDAGRAINGGCAPPSGYVLSNTDCDDTLRARNPSNPEVCDDIDNDCDGSIDNNVVEVPWYVDLDGDGFGNPSVASIVSCAPVAGRTFQGGDCDDANASRNGAAPEVCDLVDNDCDTEVDEGVGVTLYRDQDGDLFGDPLTTRLGCGVQAGWSVNGGDCDDLNASRNPGNPEVCDQVADQDCNPATFPFDTDRDGYDLASCGGTDCDDDRADVHPGAMELCDRRDNRCQFGGGTLATEDADQDGHAPPGVCTGGPLPSDDCDDAESRAYPGSAEVCDGVDNDCNGSTDEDPAAAASCNGEGTIGACVAGTCSISACTTPYANCDGISANGCEANLQAANANCGACGSPCPGGATCDGATCYCPANAQTLCGGRCSDILTDEAHCGGCGQVCPTGATCEAGVCGCETGLSVCGGLCVDTMASATHCGGCGQGCVGGSCAGGACSCPGLMPMTCDGVCRDVAGDNLNCGACNDTCIGGSCAGGVCECGVGRAACDGACTDVLSDRDNCGGCGQECIPGASCVDGGCSPDVTVGVTVGDLLGAPASGSCTRPDGSLVVAGRVSADLHLPGGSVEPRLGATGFNVFLIVLGTDGDVLWHVVHDRTRGDAQVACGPSGEVFLASNIFGTLDFGGATQPGTGLSVTKFSASGAHVWSRRNLANHTFGSDFFRGLCVSPNGHLNALVELKNPLDFGQLVSSAGDEDVALVQLDAATGNHNWTRAWGDGLRDFPTSMACAPDNSVVLGGYFSGTMTFPPNTYVASSQAGFVAVLSDQGVERWSRQTSTSRRSRVWGVAAGGSSVVAFANGESLGTDLGGGVLKYQHALGAWNLTTGAYQWSASVSFTESSSGAIALEAAGARGYVLGTMSGGNGAINYPGAADVTWGTSYATEGVYGTVLYSFEAGGDVGQPLLLDGPADDTSLFIHTAIGGHVWAGGLFTGLIDIGGRTLSAAGRTNWIGRYTIP